MLILASNTTKKSTQGEHGLLTHNPNPQEKENDKSAISVLPPGSLEEGQVTHGL